MLSSDDLPHSHAHAHLSSRAVPTSRLTRLITILLLAAVAGATAIGLVVLWPDYAKVGEVAELTQYSAQGVDLEQGEVLSIDDDCTRFDDPMAVPGAEDAADEDEAGGTASEADAAGAATLGACLSASIGVRSGPDAGRMIEVPVRGPLANAGLRPGDRVELIATPDASGAGSASAGYDIANVYNVSGVFRNLPLALLTLLFAAVVIAVGRIRGLLALIALGISVGVLLAFVLPALVAGGPGLLIGIVGSSAIMFVILYLVHGPNMRTTAALIGTLCGILIMAGISLLSVQVTRLSGIGDEASGILSSLTSPIDFRGLLTCSIIIAGLGVLNDVTITQASAVWELRSAAPSMSRGEIYARAMRIGRDHIASTVYTVFFAYVGAALSVLILLYLYDRPVLSLLTQEDIATEIVRTLCGSIGLVLAVPITTWVAALFAAPADERPGGAGTAPTAAASPTTAPT
ncbi:YibE/F family protein, partial [Leucobacter soli]